MIELKVNQKCKLIYAENRKSGALLFYRHNKGDKPFSTIEYWEYDKDYRKMELDFKTDIYGKERIENYWKEILQLDEKQKLTLDTLSDTIDNVLFKGMD
jgi:hypothetical protein